jgi:hypothetical protein
MSTTSSERGRMPAKKRQTMGKISRERELRERREMKKERKERKKLGLEPETVEAAEGATDTPAV